MNKAIVDGAFAVEHSIKDAEQASSEAAIQSARLVATLLEQHRSMRIPDAIGLKAIRHSIHALGLAAELREAQIRVHGALNLDLKKLGLDELFAKTDDPPAFDWRTFAGAGREPENRPA